MPPTAVFRGTREDLRAALRAIPGLLTGRSPDPHGIARMVQLRLGTVLLSKIQQAFLVKSRRGTGDDGIRWAELAPATVRKRLAKDPAYRRARRAGKRAGTGTAPYAGQLDIGRATAGMLRSLTPGVEGEPPANPDQVIRPGPGELVVGSNLDRAGWFHEGTETQPARPLWPDDRLPDPWADALADALVRVIPLVLQLVLRGGRA